MSTCSDDASDKECPLCMETLELDDIDFYPCKCEYQICRFCWHRIRTDENGLCPACRQPYPEDPVNFKPMSSDDVRKHKDEKRMKKQAEKLKISDARQYLCNYRVLQKNLVYVVGLSPRVSDSEILKKNEYFGRYGKIQKIVTSPTSGPGQHQNSHTAYVTYKKVEDALRAIQGVHNSMFDGRLVKASLGTTKYCSSFLSSRKCFKPECMYLHETADAEISFTKEDMHIGKHTEYEKRLIESINSRPPPAPSTIASQLDKILAPSASSSQSRRPPTETTQETNGSNAGADAERTGSAAQIPAEEPEDDTKSLNTNDVGDESEAQEANVAQFQSVDDPTPSNLADETVSSRRSNATARERQWSERDQISVAPSNSPPTDPEANEIEFDEEEINRSNLSERMSKLEVNEDRLDRSLPYSDHDYQHTGIPAPAKHQEAPAPLMQWEALLGLTTQQPAAPPVVEPTSLFSSFKLDTFNTPSMFATQSTATNPFRREPNSPPGLPRFNSDDDLGFDPFTESSKGLSELLQEEQEQIPPQSSSGHSLDVLKQLFSQMPEQRHQAQQLQNHQTHQSHQLHQSHQSQHHPLQQHQDQHSFLHQLHSQQQHQPQHQPQQYPDMSRQDFMFNRMMQSQMHQHQQPQRPFDSAPGFGHPFGNVQQHQPSQQSQAHASQSNSLLQDLFNRQQQQQHQQQQAQQVQQQHQQMYQGLNSFMFNEMLYPRVPYGMAPPPGLQAPSGNRGNVMPPPHLSQSSLQQQSQSQQQQPQQQSMNLFGMGHSLMSQQHPPQQSAQDAFKALLPNVNVRFMDDSSMARWSHENSLRSAAVPPPPGFSSMVNR